MAIHAVDDRTYEEYLERYTPLIERLTRQWDSIHNYEPDDIRQELRIVLFRAMQLYRSDRGARFLTYLMTAMANRLANIWSRQERRVRVSAGGRKTLPLLDRRRNVFSLEAELGSRLARRMAVRTADEDVDFELDLRRLSPEAQRVAAGLLAGYRISELTGRRSCPKGTRPPFVLTREQADLGRRELREFLERRP